MMQNMLLNIGSFIKINTSNFAEIKTDLIFHDFDFF